MAEPTTKTTESMASVGSGRSGDRSGDLSGDLRAVAQASAALAMQHIQARIGEVLFGEPAEPLRLGRLVLLERLGQGGMGVVYSAYDPELDRRVAVKLLRERLGQDMARARERLMREARALARLSHPNVVPIHDVGVVDGHIFLVMEHVAGRTLAAWSQESAAGKRSWRDIIAVYLEAGRGLAAAHDLGLVHRDFKPQNAILGADGRVRVVDFGLARRHAGITTSDETTPEPTPEPGSEATTEPGQQAGGEPGEPAGGEPIELASTHACEPGTWPAVSRLTATGTVLGTPAYMAPEQLLGGEVGPAADQFSFCVSLHEALYGQRPFAGESLADLRKAVLAGQVREPPRDSAVPPAIHRALVRGLAPVPGDRHPSLRELLAALGREPGRRRRRVALALGALAALAAAALIAQRLTAGAARPAVAVCQDGKARVARLWNDEQRRHVSAAFSGQGSAYARAVVPAVLARLDRYRDTLAGTDDEVCMAYHRGQQSDSLYDKQRICLEERQSALASATRVLAAIDASSLSQAMNVVAGLPAVAYCTDTEALAALTPPARDPAVARQVSALRRELIEASALEAAGRYREALDRSNRVIARIGAGAGFGSGDAAHASGPDAAALAAVLAEARLASGRVLLFDHRMPAAAEELAQAMTLGLENGLLPDAVEAAARLFYVEGMLGQELPAITAQASVIEAIGKRVGDHELARPLLFNNLGAVYMARGDKDRARSYFQAARDAMAKVHDGHVELVNVKSNLAMITPAAREREELAADAWQSLRDALGEAHPLTLAARVAEVHYTRDIARTRGLLDGTCAAYEAYHAAQEGQPDLVNDRWLRCLYYLGFLAAEQGDQPAALAAWDRTAALASATGVDHFRWIADLSRGWAALHRHDRDAARSAFQGVLDSIPGSPPWWIEARAAQARLGLGLVSQAGGKHAIAIGHLEQARAIFLRVSAINEDVEPRQLLAATELALARSSCQAGGAAGAAALFASAESWFRDGGPGYARRLDELSRARAACQQGG